MKINEKTKKTVKVNHHQTYRLSNNFNNAECSFSLTTEVEDDDLKIKKEMSRLEKLIDGKAMKKLKEQANFLAAIR